MTDGNTPIRIYRQFRPVSLILRHPMRIVIWAMLMFLLFPELNGLAEKLFSLSGGGGTILITGMTFIIFFGALLSVYYIEYKFYPVLIYSDRIEFLESALLRNYHRLEFRNIKDVKTKSGPLQKRNNLHSLFLNVRAAAYPVTAKDYWVEIADLKNSENIAPEIRQRL